MTCVSCGYELNDNARFCKSCGTPVTISAEPINYVLPEGFTLYQNGPSCYRYTFDLDGAPQVIWYNIATDEYDLCDYYSGKSLFKYDAPEGFEFDAEKRRYVRMEFDANETLWMVWFNAVTGEYEEVGYPEEPPKEEPPPVLPASSANVPDGFTLDPGSGLYYKAMPGINPENGAYGTWYTWLKADTNEYKQQFFPR